MSVWVSLCKNLTLVQILCKLFLKFVQILCKLFSKVCVGIYKGTIFPCIELRRYLKNSNKGHDLNGRFPKSILVQIWFFEVSDQIIKFDGTFKMPGRDFKKFHF